MTYPPAFTRPPAEAWREPILAAAPFVLLIAVVHGHMQRGNPLALLDPGHVDLADLMARTRGQG